MKHNTLVYNMYLVRGQYRIPLTCSGAHTNTNCCCKSREKNAHRRRAEAHLLASLAKTQRMTSRRKGPGTSPDWLVRTVKIFRRVQCHGKSPLNNTTILYCYVAYLYRQCGNASILLLRRRQCGHHQHSIRSPRPPTVPSPLLLCTRKKKEKILLLKTPTELRVSTIAKKNIVTTRTKLTATLRGG